MERDDLIAARARYLRKIKEYREAGKKIIYLDETWINAGHTVGKEWFDCAGKGRVKKWQGKGGRWIVVDAGGEDGFVDSVSWVFRGVKDEGDYHTELNHSIFLKWFKVSIVYLITCCQKVKALHCKIHFKASQYTGRFSKNVTSDSIQNCGII